MFKTEITYSDYSGNEQTETFRFNLTETEISNLAIDSPIFDVNFLKFLVDDGNIAAMFKVVQTLILESYGVMSDDGKTFRKSEELKNDFKCSAAYDALIQKMLNTEDKTLVSDFMVGIFPAKFADKLRESVDGSSLVVIK